MISLLQSSLLRIYVKAGISDPYIGEDVFVIMPALSGGVSA